MSNPLAKAEQLAAQGKTVEAAKEAARVGRQAIQDMEKALNPKGRTR